MLPSVKCLLNVACVLIVVCCELCAVRRVLLFAGVRCCRLCVVCCSSSLFAVGRLLLLFVGVVCCLLLFCVAVVVC